MLIKDKVLETDGALETDKAKSVLAEVARIMDNKALALREEAEGVIAEQKKRPIVRRVVAGFEVEVPELAAVVEKKVKAAEKIKDSVLDFFKEKNKIIEKLTKEGISPLAVVPKKTWDEICEKFGLVRFEKLDEEGRAEISSEFFENTGTELLNILMLVSVLTFAIGVNLIPVIFKGVGEFPTFGDRLLATIMSAFMGFMICGVMLVGLFSKLTDKAARKWFIYRVKCQSHSKIVKIFWPEGHDAVGGRAWSGIAPKLRVSFPETSADFLETLKKAATAEYDLCTAAVPEAIGFNLGELDGAIKEYEIRREEAKKADPILYFISGNYVAILDKFGEFPQEEKLLEFAAGLAAEI